MTIDSSVLSLPLRDLRSFEERVREFSLRNRLRKARRSLETVSRPTPYVRRYSGFAFR